MTLAAIECGIRALLAWVLLFAVANGFAQNVGSSSTSETPMGASLSRNAVTSDPNSGDVGERLMQLLRSRPELAAILKSYLAQELRTEGAEVDEKSITNQMLYRRIQTDPKFARRMLRNGWSPLPRKRQAVCRRRPPKWDRRNKSRKTLFWRSSDFQRLQLLPLSKISRPMDLQEIRQSLSS